MRRLVIGNVVVVVVMAGVYYNTDYFPTPGPSAVVTRNRGYKLKRYDDGVRRRRLDAATLRSEFERLHAQGYTHVANMPARLTDVCYNARCFRMCVVDGRLTRRIADLCATKIF